MSLPDSTSDRPRGVLVRKPRTSVYTWLVFAALAALTIGSALLALEAMRYGPLPPFGRPWDTPANLR